LAKTHEKKMARGGNSVGKEGKRETPKTAGEPKGIWEGGVGALK